MLLLDSNKYNGDPSGVMAQINKILEKHNVDVQASRPWDERRLAYPIRKHKKGTYYLLFFRAPTASLKGIEADFNLNETILRHMFVRHDEKMLEPLMALGKDEHALAIQAPGLAEDTVDGVPTRN
jgi:small subunit ribosomal protein S6